jgi:hypothetical protein
MGTGARSDSHADSHHGGLGCIGVDASGIDEAPNGRKLNSGGRLRTAVYMLQQIYETVALFLNTEAAQKALMYNGFHLQKPSIADPFYPSRGSTCARSATVVTAPVRVAAQGLGKGRHQGRRQRELGLACGVQKIHHAAIEPG